MTVVASAQRLDDNGKSPGNLFDADVTAAAGAVDSTHLPVQREEKRFVAVPPMPVGQLVDSCGTDCLAAAKEGSTDIARTADHRHDDGDGQEEADKREDSHSTDRRTLLAAVVVHRAVLP